VEVSTSTPYPLTGTNRTTEPQKEGEEDSFAAEDIQAAERFLQTMAKPWNAGRATARKCAPRLLKAMREQEWPGIRELDAAGRKLLEQDITKNPGGVINHAHVLPRRVDDLSLYSTLTRPGRQPRQTPQGGCQRHPGFQEDDCPHCYKAEQQRTRRAATEPAPVNGAALLASLQAAAKAAEAS